MTRPADHAHDFLYIDCDVPDGATLTEWRRANERERRTERVRPSLRLPSLRLPRARVRFA